MYYRATVRCGKRGRDDEPDDVLRSIGPEPWNVAYVEPSRRPADGRYGDNPTGYISIISIKSL